MMEQKKAAVFTVYPYLLERQKATAKAQNLTFDLTTYCVIERIRTVIEEVQRKQGRGTEYYESRHKLAELLAVSPSQIDNSFHALKTMGLIVKTRKEILPRQGKPGKNAHWKLAEGKWRKFISWCKTQSDLEHKRWKTTKEAPEHVFYTYIPAFHRQTLGFNRTAQIQYFELHCLYHKNGCTDVSKFTSRAGVCRASHYNYVNTTSGIGQKCFQGLFEEVGGKYRLKNRLLEQRLNYLPKAQKERKERLSYTIKTKKPEAPKPLTQEEAFRQIEAELSRKTESRFPFPASAFAPELKNCLNYIGQAFDLSEIREDLDFRYRNMLNRLGKSLPKQENEDYATSFKRFIAAYQAGTSELKQYFSRLLDEQQE